MKIAILGTGTWGTALARMLANNEHEVYAWSALSEEIDMLNSKREHVNLPGVELPKAIVFTKNIDEACKNAELIVFSTPSVYIRSTVAAAAPFITGDQILVDVAKGIEPNSHLTMTQVIHDELSKHGKLENSIVALSGPSHAEEVSRDLPTTIVAASSDMAAAEKTQDAFTNDCMRVYTHFDVEGVELCGALKNIMALACGVSSGLGFGDNTRAALITRGLAEIKRLGVRMGCDESTFSGLAGMGDLIVTATSEHSRNNRCGRLLGQGLSAEEAIKEVGMVVEGINALPAAMQLKDEYGVEMPITERVNDVVFNGMDPKQAVMWLMTRDKRSETDN